MSGAAPALPKFQFNSSTGAPLANGTVTVYVAGSTTPTDTWSDPDLADAHKNTNPITLDSRGEAVIWLDPSVSYKFVLKNSGGVTQWTQDNISGATTANTYSASASRTSISLAADSFVEASRRQATQTFTGTGGVAIAGSNVTVNDLRVSAPASYQIFYATGSASDVVLRGADISSDATSSPNGHGVQVNFAGANRWKIVDSRLDVYNFGVLLNDTAGGTTGHIVSRNNITTQIGDAIEVNSPTTSFEDVVITGNVAKVSAGSGTSKGFGIGLAHVNGGSVVGNVIQRSWLAGIHVEDGSKNTTFVGNVAKDCQDNGMEVLLGGAGNNQASSKPTIIAANDFEAATIVAGKAGVRLIYDSNGTQTACPVVGNIVRNFESGLWLGGEAIHIADNNTIDSCTYAIRCDTGAPTFTRISGTNAVIGTAATALLYVSAVTGAMVRAGKFICSTKPTTIITKAGTDRPGCAVDGFSWPQTKLLTAGATTWTDLFPAASTNRFNGKVVIQARNASAAADNTWFTADILWDGTTLTVSNFVKEDNGALSSVATGANSSPLRVNGGSLQYGWFDASAITIRADIEFNGAYMA